MCIYIYVYPCTHTCVCVYICVCVCVCIYIYIVVILTFFSAVMAQLKCSELLKWNCMLFLLIHVFQETRTKSHFFHSFFHNQYVFIVSEVNLSPPNKDLDAWKKKSVKSLISTLFFFLHSVQCMTFWMLLGLWDFIFSVIFWTFIAEFQNRRLLIFIFLFICKFKQPLLQKCESEWCSFSSSLHPRKECNGIVVTFVYCM